MTGKHALTAEELHDVDAMLDCVRDGRDEEARWWIARETVIRALAKMRAAATAAAKGGVQ